MQVPNAGVREKTHHNQVGYGDDNTTELVVKQQQTASCSAA